jgi:emp24/gp25L/p24 family/GOLD
VGGATASWPSAQVEPRTSDCLFATVQSGEEVNAGVIVSRGGKLDIRFSISSPTAQTVFERIITYGPAEQSGGESASQRRKGHSFIATEDGAYKFCFDNTQSRWTAKVVDFDLQVRGGRVGGRAAGRRGAGQEARD